MSRKYILLLGASNDQLFIIKTAQEMGLGTVVVDGNIDAPGLKISDYSSPIDFSNVNKVTSYVNELKEKGVNICGVLTMGSDIPHIIAEIADYFGWPGPSIKTGRLATNKYEMKEAFRQANIPIPNYTLIVNRTDIFNFWHNWGCDKVVIKPTDRAGSRGVSIICSPDQIDYAYSTALDNSHNQQILLEEYIEGPQISTESILWDDRSCTPGFADRVYENMEVFWPQVMENGGFLPSLHSDTIIEEVSKLVEESARVLGITRGVAKGDVVWHHQRGAIMIEMAARLSGGDFCESLVPLGTGINYVKSTLQIAMGEEPDWSELKNKYSKAAANRYFFVPPGKLENITGIEDVINHEGIKKFKLFYEKGDLIPEIKSHGQRVGVFVVRDESRAEVQEIIDHVYNIIKFTVDGKEVSGNPKYYRKKIPV